MTKKNKKKLGEKIRLLKKAANFEAIAERMASEIQVGSYYCTTLNDWAGISAWEMLQEEHYENDENWTDDNELPWEECLEVAREQLVDYLDYNNTTITKLVKKLKEEGYFK